MHEQLIAGAIVGVDNTFATPLLQQPLALGADVVVHSATKFIGGHSDLLSGITIARDQALAGRLRRRRGLTGATSGALEAFLALRGLRTLALRLDRGQANAGELARRLDQHPAVSRVRYPGLPGDPGHRTAAAQMTGFGAVLAFEVANAPTADRLCDAVHVIVHATSLGGIESTIERRSKLPGQEHVPPRAPAPERRLRTHRRPLERPQHRVRTSNATGQLGIEPPAGNRQAARSPRHQPQRAYRRGLRRHASSNRAAEQPDLRVPPAARPSIRQHPIRRICIADRRRLTALRGRPR
jgi:hypothetical protein